MSSPEQNNSPDFEELLNELEKIVQRMEQGEQSLDESLKDFERGISLSRECQVSLDQAQQRVDKLVKKHSGYALEPMSPTDAQGADAAATDRDNAPRDSAEPAQPTD